MESFKKFSRMLFLVAAFFSLSSFTSSPSQGSGSVYISTGGYGVRYHVTSSCRGLRNASGIRSVSLEEAQRMGKTPCKICCR